MKKIVSLLAILVCSANLLFGQNIFTYGGKPVPKEEFLRMYTKNVINKQPDMSDSAIRAYVTLYSRFKMKVEEANKLRMDTLPGIQSELNNYKKQLAKTYLTDKDVVNSLAAETYKRMQQDVEVAHILISIPRGMYTTDTAEALQKIDSIYTLAKSGKDFASLAKATTQDKSTANNGGSIGWITALQTPYEFENVAYATPVGSVSKPFRTNFGYHIIKVINKRNAVGQVQLAQILLITRKSEGDDARNLVKAKADSILNIVKKNPKSWDALVEKFNEDKYTANTQGVMSPFGIGAMSADFEKAGFGLKNIGELAGPILTDYGYHIIKLVKRIPVKPFDSIKNELNRNIERDGRVALAKQTFINKIKVKNNLKEYAKGLSDFIVSIPDSQCKNNSVVLNETYDKNIDLFKIKNKTYTAKDLNSYIARSSRSRLYGYKDAALTTSYNSFLEQMLMDTEEGNLEYENADFKNLLQEYRDGIMIFELTDKSVWSKAGADTIGLKKYYDNNASKYIWQASYTGKHLRCSDLAVAQQFLQEVKTKKFEDALDIVNGTSGYKVNVEESRFEYKKQDNTLRELQVGQYSQPIKNSDNTYTIVLITKVHPKPEQKTYSEARGYVVADYQDFLEKTWLESMEQKYPIVVNEPVVKSIIKTSKSK